MIIYLFGFYFNPLTITNIKQVGDNVLISFTSGELIGVDNARIHDVATMINEYIKKFQK